MDKEIVEGKIGEIGKYDVEFHGAELIATFEAAVAVGSAAVVVKISADKILDALKGAIPGVIDDLVIDAAKAAFLGK